MEPNEEDRATQLKERQAGISRQIAPFLSLGFQLASAVVILFFAGKWVDGEWGTAPFGQLIGVLVGCTGGLIKFFRATEQLNRQEPSAKQDKK